MMKNTETKGMEKKRTKSVVNRPDYQPYRPDTDIPSPSHPNPGLPDPGDPPNVPPLNDPPPSIPQPAPSQPSPFELARSNHFAGDYGLLLNGERGEIRSTSTQEERSHLFHIRR